MEIQSWRLRKTILYCPILGFLFFLFPAPAGTASIPAPGSEYWMVWQPASPWPVFPHLWLFAPEGEANVKIRNHTGAETQVHISGCGFTKFSLRNPGGPWLDWGNHYTDVRSDRELWIVGEHRKPDGTHVPDPGLAHPHDRFIRNLYMGAAWDKTSLNDALIVVYAPTTANLTMTAWVGPYDGWVAPTDGGEGAHRTRIRTVTGVATFEPYYVIAPNRSWVLKIEADTPVAMEVMDAGGFWRWDINGNGYQDDWVKVSGLTDPGTEYIMDRDVTWAGARFQEGGGMLQVFGPDGALRFLDVITQDQGKVWGTSAGTSVDSPIFPTGPQRWVGSVPFAPDITAPTRAEQTLDSATFFGFRPDLSRLHIFNDAPTPVTMTVINAKNPSLTAVYEVPAWSASVRRVSTLGLGWTDTEPFLLAVRASRPVFTSVEIDRMGGYLRPYPFRLFEVCPTDAPAPSAAVPCFEIKVPPAGRRRVSGTCLTVMGDVCHDTGSPVAARAAIASVRFEYRSGDGSWNSIPPSNPGFPNPDSGHPWLLHWDVSGLPETGVQIRAVVTDTAGATRASEVREIVVDHVNWEIRNNCSGSGAGAGSSAEARVMAGRSVEISAGGAVDGTGGRNLRVVAAAGAIPGDDLLMAEVVASASVETAPFPPGWTGVGEFREVNLASGRSRLDGFVDLYLSYADENGDGLVDEGGVPAESLRGYSLDDSGTWRSVETVGVDTFTREVHLRTDHFTLFALAVPAAVGEGDGACLITRGGLFGMGKTILRGLRDILLTLPGGRLLVSFYSEGVLG